MEFVYKEHTVSNEIDSLKARAFKYVSFNNDNRANNKVLATLLAFFHLLLQFSLVI